MLAGREAGAVGQLGGLLSDVELFNDAGKVNPSRWPGRQNCVNVSRGKIPPHQGSQHGEAHEDRQTTTHAATTIASRPSSRAAPAAIHPVPQTPAPPPPRPRLPPPPLHRLPPPPPRNHRTRLPPLAQPRTPRPRIRHRSTPPPSTATSTPPASTPNAAATPSAPSNFIIEKAESIVPTANEIINAVRACSRLNDEGQWIDPPKQRIITYVDEHGNPLPASAKDAAKSTPQPKTTDVTNVTSPKTRGNQSPTPAIRNWFNSLKTNATRLIQSPTFHYFSKSQKSASATPHTATVTRGKIATEATSQPPQPHPVASISLNRIFPGLAPGSPRVTLPMYQDSSPDNDPDPANVDVPVSYLLL